MEAIFNRHANVSGYKFTIEFEVKNPNLEGVSEDLHQYEWETGTFTNQYGQKLFEEFNNKFLEDWGLDGRSGGWFVLICNGNQEQVQQRTLSKMERIVEKYFKEYGTNMKKFYGVE
jgi:hypothetical protein